MICEKLRSKSNRRNAGAHWHSFVRQLRLARKTLSRVPLFKGRGPRGALFIENEPTGNLYLRFNLH